MATSELDNLKTSRRVQATRNAQKLRLQPIDFVHRSTLTQNAGLGHELQKTMGILNKEHDFRSQKIEGQRRQFVAEQRRLLRPAIAHTATSDDLTEAPAANPDSAQATAFPDLESDLLRIVEYYEIHKPNTVRRIHKVRHLNPAEEKELRQAQKLKSKKAADANLKLGSNVSSQDQPPKGNTVSRVYFTHRGDMTEKERNDAFGKRAGSTELKSGLYLSTPAQAAEKSTDLSASMNSNTSRVSFEKQKTREILPDGSEKDNHEYNEHDTSGSAVPLVTLIPPIPTSQGNVRRYQSPPSTKKFRHYKVRTSLSDRPGGFPQVGTKSGKTTPRLTKSHTPFSDDLPAYQVSMSADADFKAALTESNLLLHGAMQHHPHARPSGRPTEPRRMLVTPSLAESLDTMVIDDYDTYQEARTHMTPMDVHLENEAILGPLQVRNQAGAVMTRSGKRRPVVHETIQEETTPRQPTKPRLFKSKRYGDSYLVPSDVRRTCAHVPFDPYVLAMHKKEVEEIETRKRLKDIAEKLDAQRKTSQCVQSNVNDWVKSVAKPKRPKRVSPMYNGKTWQNIA